APAGPSMAMIKPFARIRHTLARLSQRLQTPKKFGERLGDAPRIADTNSRYAKADEREAHRHAVIVVGLDFAAVNHGGLDHELIVRLAKVDAQPRELARHGGDAVRLLPAGMPDAADPGRRSGERREPRGGQKRVGDAAEIVVDTAKLFAGDDDAIRRPAHLGAHAREHVDKGDVSLKRTRSE